MTSAPARSPSPGDTRIGSPGPSSRADHREPLAVMAVMRRHREDGMAPADIARRLGRDGARGPGGSVAWTGPLVAIALDIEQLARPESVTTDSPRPATAPRPGPDGSSGSATRATAGPETGSAGHTADAFRRGRRIGMAIGFVVLMAMAAAALVLPLFDSSGARLDPDRRLDAPPAAAPIAGTSPTTMATSTSMSAPTFEEADAAPTTTSTVATPTTTVPPRRTTPTTAVVPIDDPGTVTGLDRALVGVDNNGGFGSSFWIEDGVIRHIGDARDFWECFALTGGTRHVIRLDVLERSGLPLDWANQTDRCSAGPVPELPIDGTHPNPYESSVIVVIDGPVATAMWVEDGSLRAVADDGDYWDCYVRGVGVVHTVTAERLAELDWQIDRLPADRCPTPSS